MIAHWPTLGIFIFFLLAARGQAGGKTRVCYVPDMVPQSRQDLTAVGSEFSLV